MIALIHAVYRLFAFIYYIQNMVFVHLKNASNKINQ